MPLLKDGRIVEDPWIAVADGDAPPAQGPVVVPYAIWRDHREALLKRNTPLGVRLAGGEPPSLIAEDLPRLALVALDFAGFKDGRGYSHARLLRERYGFAGELRAVGEVLRDQLLFLHRCGFDAFEVADGRAVDGWDAALSEISVFYQPTGDAKPPVAGLRHPAAGRRRPAPHDDLLIAGR